MAYKSLLLHLDGTEACAARTEAAIALAERDGAHLVGLYPTAEPAVPTFVAGTLPSEVLREQARQAGGRAEQGLAAFREACTASGVAHEERLVRCDQNEVDDVLCLHARYADLLVMGQSDSEDPMAPPPALLQDVILGAGRPVLAIPYIGVRRMPAEKVAIAWDSGREAARAVADSLPLLSSAKAVTVLAVNPKVGADGHGEQPGADIATHLARHGLKVEVQRSQSPDASIGDSLLSRLADLDSDLLVMGAYGHARLRQVILGGVTRTLLEQMTVPLLLSH